MQAFESRLQAGFLVAIYITLYDWQDNNVIMILQMYIHNFSLHLHV